MSSVEMRERVTEWLTSPDTCFLIGAGCSRCANKPLIGQLTTTVLANLDKTIKDEFDGLSAVNGRPPTIEDLINYLVRYKAILSTVKDPANHKLAPAWIDDAIKSIKREIVAVIVDDWQTSPVHERLFTRIGNQKRPIDVFSLNYDTLIEATLDGMRANYVDGFRGSNRAWFDPTTFDEANGYAGTVRLYKMHGSINWLREVNGHVRRAIVRKVDDLTDEPVVVYPSEQKYLQTQFGIYESLMGRFRNRLRGNGVNARLVTIGYSFNDEHINEAIIDAVMSSGSNLTVIGFIGPDTDVGAQIERMKAISDRCDQRFNCYIGNSNSFGTALAEDETDAVLKEELWKFESLVDFIAGPAI
jgi:SIR2-like domain